MQIPEQYKNLNIKQKRIVVKNIILKYGNKETQALPDNLWDNQIDFLFTYFFTENKDNREKLRKDLQIKYENALKEIEEIAKQIQVVELKYKELLWIKTDLEDLEILDEEIQSL